MNLITELQNSKQKVLIIDKKNTSLRKRLKEALEKYDNDVFISPQLPQNLTQFSLSFFLNESWTTFEKMIAFRKTLQEKQHKKFIFIVLNDEKKANQFANEVKKSGKSHIKVIGINQPYISPEDVEKILWFSVSESDEVFLFLNASHPPKKSTPKQEQEPISFFFNIQPQKLLLLFIFLLVLSQLLFIPPLLLASYNLYKGITTLRSEDKKSVHYMHRASVDLSLSQKLYTIAKPTLQLFSISFFTDNLFQINETGYQLAQELRPLSEKGKIFMTLVMQKQKTPQEKQQLLTTKNEIDKELDTVHTDITFLDQKLPSWNQTLVNIKNQLKTAITTLEMVQRISPSLESILANNTEKKYLLMFANNMELRPGGGFIGSFGVLTAKDYSIENIQIYDVYDADGQLTEEITPPDAIRIHLNQTHWFLRDSAFDPDFLQNYKQARMFLGKEMPTLSFDGGVLITTTALQYILKAFDNLYIPDYGEKVTADNFYLKAQMYAEKDFFPGSLQKKRFLGAVMNQLLLQLDQASLPTLAQMAKKALDEKQVVLTFDDDTVQHSIDEAYWSGRIISPTCTSSSQNCIIDYLFPVDANLGVNKANFFVSRTLTQQVTFDKQGNTHHKFTVKIKNDSPDDVFPGGTYKNYFQLYLPVEANIKQVTRNDILVEDYDQLINEYKTIGFLVEIKPRTSQEISVEYELDNDFSDGKKVYQLVIQKQIGGQNADFNLRISFPSNIHIMNQNFSALVKDNQINYNTTITTDKIFFIELLKE